MAERAFWPRRILHATPALHANMVARTFLLTALCCAAAAASAPGEEIPDVEISLPAPVNSVLLVRSAAFGPGVPDAPGSTFSLYIPSTPLGCGPIAPAVFPAGTPPPAALLQRGNCSFAEKAVAAGAAGYRAIIVADSLLAAYPALSVTGGSPASNETGLAASTCSYSCAAGSGTVPAANVTVSGALSGYPGACGSGCGACVLTQAAPVDASGTRQVCCYVSDLMEMGTSSAAAASAVAIPAVFATWADGNALASVATRLTPVQGQEQWQGMPPAAAGSAADEFSRLRDAASSSIITLGARATRTVDAASMLMVALAVAIVVLGSWRSAAPERLLLRELVAVRAAGEEGATAAAAARARARAAAASDASLALTASDEGDRAPITIGVREGLCMLVGAATVLGLLFLLVRLGVPIIYFVIALFSIAAWQAVAQAVLLPSLAAAIGGVRFNKLAAASLLRCSFRGAPLRLPAAHTGAFLLSAIIVIVWIAVRQASWAWLLNDALGVALCVSFAQQMRISALRTACIILGLFFAYDVFAVFLTPFIFGSSAMIDVATAGAPEAVPNWACWCRLHPDDSKSCGPGETMPILLRLPRLQDYRGGYSMLGLGDIVIPVLAVGLALRWDAHVKARGLVGGDVLAVRRARVAAGVCCGASYWFIACAGYTLGLGIAIAAVTAFQSGQPALLYIVPCTLLPLLALANARGDLSELWNWNGECGSESPAAGGEAADGVRQAPGEPLAGAGGADGGADDSGDEEVRVEVGGASSAMPSPSIADGSRTAAPPRVSSSPGSALPGPQGVGSSLGTADVMAHAEDDVEARATAALAAAAAVGIRSAASPEKSSPTEPAFSQRAQGRTDSDEEQMLGTNERAES